MADLEREDMVALQLAGRGLSDPDLLDAFRQVPREEFIPVELRHFAYADRPLGIGFKQTISQPFVVAATLNAAGIHARQRVLEIGTGSGYQTAILSQMGATVYTIEIVPELAERARQTLTRLGFKNIHYKVGGGYEGWPDAAPFDAILLSASPKKIPQALIDQLKVGGRLVGPEGEDQQKLMCLTRLKNEVRREELFDVRFVPMIETPSTEN